MNAYLHNAGVACLGEDEPLFVAEQERFDRVKKSGAFPRGALDAARAQGCDLADVERMLVPWSRRRLARTFTEAFFAGLPHTVRTAVPSASPNWNLRLPFSLYGRLRHDLERSLGTVPLVEFIEHHHAHAAAAYYPSPFDEALVVVADALGDHCSFSAYVGRGETLTELRRNWIFDSLGAMYSCVTLYLGYRSIQDEGKVMALASMGTDALRDEFAKVVRLGEEGTFELDFDYFSFNTRGERRPFTRKFIDLFGPPRRPGEPIEQRHLDLAAAAQATLEHCLMRAISWLSKEHGLRNLAYGGGVALSCVANGRIARETGIERVFVPPSPDDGGVTLGAALYWRHQVEGRSRSWSQTHPYYGSGFDDSQIDAAIGSRQAEYINDPSETAAQEIADGRVVGWFQGRMEMGPRALGNRSILADPRSPTMQQHLNRNVKHRESYRPYAPSVLAEQAAGWFPGTPDSPFMSFSSDAAPTLRELIPAATHVDGTARIQTVRAADAPLYHRLITRFADITGVPMVLNTSLNDSEPICCSPEDAIRCFERTGIDVLVLGNRMLTKDQARTAFPVDDSRVAGAR